MTHREYSIKFVFVVCVCVCNWNLKRREEKECSRSHICRNNVWNFLILLKPLCLISPKLYGFMAHRSNNKSQWKLEDALKDDKNTTNQKLYDAGKVILRRFFIELNVYIKGKKG